MHHNSTFDVAATRNNCMLEIISSDKSTAITVQGGQQSQINVPPNVTVMTHAYSCLHTNIPCAHELMQQQRPTLHLDMPFLPHEQMEWRPPVAHMPFLPHEQMQWNPSGARTPSEMMQIFLLPPQAIPELSANDVQDDDMIVEVGSSEESISLIGEKRKMDQSEGPGGKQARTTQ